jgi:chromosome segregation ATPase
MEIQEPDLKEGSVQANLVKHFSLIFNTGLSEIKRKGTVTRLYFEIKSFEKDKEKFVRDLGNHAWEAHVDHPDVAGIIVHLKELQIDINRLGTQFGEHDTQIKDIEFAKVEFTRKFNEDLDQFDQKIAPHRQKIETINAEKEDNKIQIEDLRSKQDNLSQQVRVHQANIQELDLVENVEKKPRIELEKAAIRNLFMEKCEIECNIPFLMSNIEKLKVTLAAERSEIEKLEQEKETIKRGFEQRIKDYNNQIHQLDEKKKQTARQMENLKREMEPFLLDLGRRVEQLRLEEGNFRETYGQLDGLKAEIEDRQKQIEEAESLSRAMDRSAWNTFLLVSGTFVVLILSLVLFLFH